MEHNAPSVKYKPKENVHFNLQGKKGEFTLTLSPAWQEEAIAWMQLAKSPSPEPPLPRLRHIAAPHLGRIKDRQLQLMAKLLQDNPHLAEMTQEGVLIQHGSLNLDIHTPTNRAIRHAVNGWMNETATALGIEFNDNAFARDPWSKRRANAPTPPAR